mmetsp:Transcript_24162/g.51233  ORF Transcript_24162/g.51233 Transcript_24162/m.51233 type:complete len:602 (+) Transcript_24162:323-2128(+)|eukprot:CAMPEP_0183721626 /NCGR_PEP_ID=MMETSP0737-20130205/13837_1 /TAXON_ID=385413 /ORGANISM="Thalassiosira miniscula, Strain CCMP1093" /LENGTH=601 /DNA_ID=CAMNT_0025951663 /DNA_START=298 /DNA_END=2103 /DNA_ORIENTATION=+
MPEGAQKFLSYPAILAIAANTMNGPAFTTLPDVAADAGLLLYITLIGLSVAMAAFVCRRMVYAMWASLETDPAGIAADVEKGGNYDTMKVDSGSLQSMGLSSSGNQESMEATAEIDEIVPAPSSEGGSQLIHREHEHTDEGGSSAVQEESLLSNKEHNENMAVIEKRNRNQPVLEHTAIVGQSREAYGKKASIYVAFTMVASALCLALAQMMLCAAILDGMFVALGGKSCAFGLPTPTDPTDPTSSPSWIHCTSNSSMKPYAGSGAPTSLISIGAVIAATASVAMGTVDLDEMMSIQYFLFGCLVIAAVRFSVVLKNMANGLGTGDDDGDLTERMLLGEDEDLDGSGDSASLVDWFIGPNPFQTIGPIMFNFAFVVTSPPSSAMAKKESIAYKALGMSCVVMGAMYATVGLCGAKVSNAVRNGMIEGGSDSNLLSLILLSGGKDGASMFDLCIIGLFGFSTVASIPVYCLLAKETLVNDAGVAPLPSFLLSNVVPWILVALTYNAAFFEAFVNWSGLLILGYANFSLPLLLDLKLKKVRAARAVSKIISSDEESVTKLTKGVLILVTASITLVIVMSITNSLMLASAAFILTVGLMHLVKV